MSVASFDIKKGMIYTPRKSTSPESFGFSVITKQLGRMNFSILNTFGGDVCFVMYFNLYFYKQNVYQ